MKIEDFNIGKPFYSSAGFMWLCTDIGTRTISAIFLDPNKTPAWFYGPPYSVNELVFDEIDIDDCYMSEIEMISKEFNSESLHPSFNHEDAMKMSKETLMDNQNNSFIKRLSPLKLSILKRDRVDPNYNIVHPYSLYRDSDGWYVKFFDLFNRTYSMIHENTFITYPIAQRTDFEKAIFINNQK